MNSGFDKYCEAFTNIVCNNIFANTKILSGNDILSITPIRQLNLLVIKNIQISWKNEIKHLESPYFDYSHPEVEKALKQFSNTLSRFISVNRENFSDLLKKSVGESILLAVSPRKFFSDLIEEGLHNTYSITDFREIAKYIKINNHVLPKILEDIEKRGDEIERIKIQLDAHFNDASFDPDDSSTLIEGLSEIYPLPKELLIDQEKSFAITKEDFKDEIVFDLTEKKSPLVAKEKILNDTFSVENNVTISDSLHRKKIDDIKKSLTINQKFMFVDHLFSGEVQSFENAVNRIEQFSSLKEAVQFINANFKWDMESEEVAEFMDIVEKRFH